MSANEVLDALDEIAAVFADLGVAYYVGGSIASSAYGVARATIDVDVVADIKPHRIVALATTLAPRFYIDENTVREAVMARTSFNVVHLETMMKIDVFLLKDTDYDQIAFDRRRQDRLAEDANAPQHYLASCEDVVLAKLKWFKAGGATSQRQWSDVKGVLAVQQGNLDRSYMLQWARNLGVLDLLEKADGETAAT